ncbi:DUF2235 domain-containing protein [Sphingorhabdus sp. Alg239-R122]|uniref:DUF2235 domain-containing protein n=1 Tax=Sphingorhabdus sp. Alg239-R122 TaxID=2305989 RepID=UPI0013DD200D|nr:DUF2235 domain-containing protein [Sphingorhabdus sp. Alg239-R122]
MPKNIVICLDGTGNQIEENISNVLKLYRAVDKSSEQLVFYDQGVGTLGRIYTWGWLKQKLKNGLGLAFGLGLDRNVLKAYEFIVQNYEDYDNIYIFGFSRGAHTARVLAGMIYEVGILRAHQIHLSGAALTAYKQAPRARHDIGEAIGEDVYEGEGANFRRVAQPRTAAVRFLGLWDTVSSVFVPNVKTYFPPIVREDLPHTKYNPAVRMFRQAASIDERRRMFRLDGWEEGQPFKPNIHSLGEPDAQDARQVWFAGYHSDVGGGHKRAESGTSQFPLIWMISEAEKAGLRVFGRMARYVSGIEPYSDTTRYLYPEPDPAGKLHPSLKGFWCLLEVIPKRNRRSEWPERRNRWGVYLPLGERRYIAADANIHSSVYDRIKLCPDYDPPNLP